MGLQMMTTMMGDGQCWWSNWSDSPYDSVHLRLDKFQYDNLHCAIASQHDRHVCVCVYLCECVRLCDVRFMAIVSVRSIC